MCLQGQASPGVRDSETHDNGIIMSWYFACCCDQSTMQVYPAEGLGNNNTSE